MERCTGEKKECGQSGEDSHSRPVPSGSDQPLLDTSLLYLSSDAAKYSFSRNSENTFFAF